MVNFCCVIQCSARADREEHLSYFRIPGLIKHRKESILELSSRRQREWLARINTKNVWEAFNASIDGTDPKAKKLKSFRVCSQHFITGKPADLKDDTNPDWVPSLNMGHNEVQSNPTTSKSDRHNRRLLRGSLGSRQPAAEALLSLSMTGMEDDEPDPQETLRNELASVIPPGAEVRFLSYADAETQASQSQPATTETATQTDLTSADLDALKAQADQFAKMNKHEHGLFTQASFEGNDKKTNFFTGLPTFAVFMALLGFIKDKLPPRVSVSPFQQLLLILMKLRLAVPNEDISYRFDVSESTVSRVFNDGIDVLFNNLGGLIRWPERETLRKTMPMQFRRSFGKRVAVIIDCFEIFCDRPSSLEARAQTFSSYKHHNTVKFLIGNTPTGVISYLSTAWGGRASDKLITLDSNFFRKLLPGDIVLADRGFNIADEAGLHGCEVEIPAFTKGKPQLTALDVEKTREIAHLRIHVERVIGCVRQKYTILNKTLPVDYLVTSKEQPMPKIDKIARVCCGLINMCEPLISSS